MLQKFNYLYQKIAVSKIDGVMFLDGGTFKVRGILVQYLQHSIPRKQVIVK